MLLKDIFQSKESVLFLLCNLSISNDIQPKWTATSGTGIGLANLAKRYRLLFKRDIQITEDREFTVCIPLIEKSQLEQ